MPTLEALKGQVMELSDADRSELAAFLAEVTPPVEPPVLDDEFRAEILRRIEELKADPAAGVPGDEAMARVRARLS